MNETQQQRKQISSQLAQCDQDHAASTHLLQELQDRTKVLTEEVQRLETALESRQSEQAQIKERINVAEKRNKELVEESVRQQHIVSDLEADISHLK